MDRQFSWGERDERLSAAMRTPTYAHGLAAVTRCSRRVLSGGDEWRWSGDRWLSSEIVRDRSSSSFAGPIANGRPAITTHYGARALGSWNKLSCQMQLSRPHVDVGGKLQKAKHNSTPGKSRLIAPTLRPAFMLATPGRLSGGRYKFHSSGHTAEWHVASVQTTRAEKPCINY